MRLLDDVVAKVVEYCSKDETRRRFEELVLGPLVRYLGERFSWGVRLFQVVTVLVFVQTLLILWLIVRDVRRAAGFPAPLFSAPMP